MRRSLKTLLARVTLVGSALFAASLSQAGPKEDLAQLLAGYDRYRASFQQYTLSENGARQEQSSGHFAIQKPDRFDWVTEQPFAQRIVGDGEFIWIYDPDLEQVTRKPSDNQADSAPSMILNGQIEELDQRFAIVRSEGDAGRAIYDLLPRESEGNFTRIRLLFDQRQLSELMLEDSLGQRTLILLDQVELNPALDADRFRFVPPAGVDLILDPGA